MLILLDKSREPIGEISDFLSITMSVRFSSPGQISMVLSEDSYVALTVQELMYVYDTDTSKLFLIDYIERNTVFNDIKSVTVKGVTIEGFLDQRIIVVDKLLDGATLQTSIKELFIENVINPVDATRKLDFFQFVDSTNQLVLNVKSSGLISGVSLMQAVTSLLESKNLGYSVSYSLTTKKASFVIVAGRNLCAGFSSALHGTNLPATVTLSMASETLKDIRSIVDLEPYKTRVYVRNFDDLLTFNRGATKSGIELREGYLSTGHGDGTFGELPEFSEPPPPELIIPPMTFPPEIPIKPPLPDNRLLGVYLMTNYGRILACAFYPGLPVPDVWYDVTPDGEPNGFSTYNRSALIHGNGDLVIQTSNLRRIYRFSMPGGWFGTRTFSKGELIFDAFDVDIIPPNPSGPSSVEVRQRNFIGAMGVDITTGRIMATVTSQDLSWPTSSGYTHAVIDGTAYDLQMRPDRQYVLGVYPGYSSLWPVMTVRDGIAMHSATYGWVSTNISTMTETAWVNRNPSIFNGENSGYRGWHARPVPDSDAVYISNAEDGNMGVMYRSKDMFEGAPLERFDPGQNMGWLVATSFSSDGLRMVNAIAGGKICFVKINSANFSDSIYNAYTQPVNPGQTFRNIAYAGRDDVSGKNLWSVLRSGSEWSSGASGVPSFYVTDKEDLTNFVDMTPNLKTFLKTGPWGLTPDDKLVEYPIHSWPIIG